jgi:hypothetical protein
MYPADSYYFNSFETTADTSGWSGIGAQNMIEDAPKVGGNYSVEISGGCVIPHAYYRFAPLAEDKALVLKCWAKNLSKGGSISLNLEDQQGHVYITVSESEWTAYESEDTLFCTAGSTLILELNSGGIISSAMRVDQIEISDVE